MRLYFFKFFFLACLFALPVQAQSDTVRIIGKTIDSIVKPAHSPSRAALYSAILPGLGQIYNRKNAYWKVPILYVGAGVIGYFIAFNNGYQLRLRQSYYAKLFDLPKTEDPYSSLSLEEANGYQKEFARYRDQLIITAIGVYGLNVLDAFVEAHLKSFDVSDDLAFRLKFKPYGETVYGQSFVGASLCLRFKR